MVDKEKQTYQYEPMEPVLSKRFRNGYSWELDGKGWHRVVSPTGEGGDWTHYPGLAISADGKYLCVSQYFGCLPEEVQPECPPDILSETLYELTRIEEE